MPAGEDAPTQPLPTVEAPPGRRPLRSLATTAAGSWLFGALLLAAEYLPQAARAPRLVRGTAWATACCCLLLGAGALACCAGVALVGVVVQTGRDTRGHIAARRRALYGAGAAHLSAHREELRAVARQAAATVGRERGALGELHLVQATAGRRSRRGGD